MPALRTFGNMAGEGHKPRHGTRAKADSKPIDQSGQRNSTISRSGLDIALIQRQRLGPARPQPEHFDSESGIHIIQLFGKKAHDVCSFPLRRSKFDLTYHHFAIYSPQAEFQPAGPQPFTFQFGCHVTRQITQGLIKQLTVTDRLQQAALYHRYFLRNDR